MGCTTERTLAAWPSRDPLPAGRDSLGGDSRGSDTAGEFVVGDAYDRSRRPGRGADSCLRWGRSAGVRGPAPLAADGDERVEEAGEAVDETERSPVTGVLGPPRRSRGGIGVDGALDETADRAGETAPPDRVCLVDNAGNRTDSDPAEPVGGDAPDGDGAADVDVALPPIPA